MAALKMESNLFRFRCVALKEELQRIEDGFKINLLIVKEHGEEAAAHGSKKGLLEDAIADGTKRGLIEDTKEGI